MARTPTLEEAAKQINRCINASARIHEIAWMRYRYGEQFARMAEELAKKKK